jgi:radical SAM protein (TIGR01212 family)
MYPWGDNRRFNSQTGYMTRRFGGRVQKLTLNAGLTCPNRDGSKGTGGCTFCNNDAFNPSYCVSSKSITRQLEEGVDYFQKRYKGVNMFLAYFQAYTNTYGDIKSLTALYEEALSFPGVTGLVIGTRPDCVPDELLDYFAGLSGKYFVIIEYGVESCYNETLKRVNRCHTLEDSISAIERTAAREIRQGVHFIIGLPGEDRSAILGEFRLVSEWPVNQIKFHQLQIVKDTRMEEEYRMDPDSFNLYSLSEYLDLMVEITEKLNPEIVIDRIAGETGMGYLVSPDWKLRYDQILLKFESLLEERKTWQGKFYRHIG